LDFGVHSAKLRIQLKKENITNTATTTTTNNHATANTTR